MKFDKALSEKLCNTIRLKESTEAIELLSSQLTAFSQDMERIKSADFDNKYKAGSCADYSSLREDNVCASSSVLEIISNSKSIKKDCFTIPKVI